MQAAKKSSIPTKSAMPFGYQKVQEYSAPRSAILLSIQQNAHDWFLIAANKWQHETAGFSSISAKVNHPSFKEIVGLGEYALPMILNDLKTNTAQWFPALKAIAKTDPVPVEHRGNISEMKRAWLKWGMKQGYIA